MCPSACWKRPFWPPKKTGAAAPAIPMNDTIKTAAHGVVTGTPDRSQLFAVQTPQVFDADLIRGALYHSVQQGAVLTDDCAAVERIGKQVVLTDGERTNIKKSQRNLICL